MEWIEKLRAATSLADLAVILNFTPSGLAHTIYKLDPKYIAFDIPKRSGGVRHMGPGSAIETGAAASSESALRLP